MKILLDENIPKRLKFDFQDVEIYTIREKRWNGKSNGELLKLLVAKHFNVLITFDKRLKFQQNLDKYPISIIVLNAVDNTYETLKDLVPKIKENLTGTLKTGVTEIKFY